MDLPKVFKMLTSGVNATCVNIPDFVKDYVIPLKCVKCENNMWTFNGTLSLGNVKACFSSASAAGINVFTLFASTLISFMFYLS